jgi:hypothetical protein
MFSIIYLLKSHYRLKIIQVPCSKTVTKNCCNTWLFEVQIITITIYIPYYIFKFLTILILCILTVLLHICDITSHYCIFICWIPPWRWPKKPETCRRITICLYIILPNYSAVFGIYMVSWQAFVRPRCWYVACPATCRPKCSLLPACQYCSDRIEI